MQSTSWQTLRCTRGSGMPPATTSQVGPVGVVLSACLSALCLRARLQLQLLGSSVSATSRLVLTWWHEGSTILPKSDCLPCLCY